MKATELKTILQEKVEEIYQMDALNLYWRNIAMNLQAAIQKLTLIENEERIIALQTFKEPEPRTVSKKERKPKSDDIQKPEV